MQYRVVRTIFVSLAAIALLTPAYASGATPAQIHHDAADGSIDGAYSVGDLRAADGAVSTEQREYYAWDDAYREKMRRLALPTRSSRDSSGGAGGGGAGGTSADAPTSASQRNAVDLGEPPAPAESRAGRDGEIVRSRPPRTKGSPPADALDVESTRTTESPSGNAPSFIWLLAALPLLVLAEGVRRARRVRRQPPLDQASLR